MKRKAVLKAQTKLFNESLLPSIPNGKTLRSFKRVVLSQSDSVGVINASRYDQSLPDHLSVGPNVVIVDSNGRARLARDGTFQDEGYTNNNSI
jgi:hypothetical protein